MRQPTVANKIDVVFIQAFPANKTITAGAIKYLSEYMNLHFIQFPGFHPNEQTFEHYTFENVSKYLEAQIDALNLDSFFLGGASAGFMFANRLNIKNAEKCVMGMIAMTPFVSPEYTTLPQTELTLRKIFLNAVKLFHLQNLWHNKSLGPFFWWILKSRFDKQTDYMLEIVRLETDPKAFFEIGELLLQSREHPLKDLVHIVILNKEDNIIDYEKTLKFFKSNLSKKNLNLIITDTPHFPKDISYEHFKDHFKDHEIRELLNAMERVKNSHMT